MTSTRTSSTLLRSNSRPLLSALCLAALTTFGCSDDTVAVSDTNEREEDTSQPEPESDAGDAGAAERDPLYVIAASFSAGDERETYLVTSRTFDENTEIDPTDGPKLLGGIVPVVHDGAVYAPDSNSPVIIRFKPNKDDKLVKDGEVSFAGVGMTTIESWHVFVINDEKAYVFDPSGPRIVVWNPTTMKLTGVQIELDEINREGFTPVVDMEPSASPKRRGSQLILPLGWADQDGNSRHASGVMILDTDEDRLVAVDEDERCGESFALVEDPAGDIYFFPPDWSALPHYFSDGFTPTCVLRVRATETQFDQDFMLDLSSLGSGSAAAGAISDGSSGFFFTTVDEELWDDGDNLDGAFWRFWHYDFETQVSAEVEDMPVWSHNCYHVVVDGKSVIPRSTYSDEGSRSTVYMVNGAGTPQELFSFPADWYGMATLR